MLANKPYAETASALYQYGREVRARTNHQYFCYMDNKRAEKSYTLNLHTVSSLPGPLVSVTIKPERQQTTSIRVLSDWWGAPLGLILGTRDRKLEKVTLEDFVDFLYGRTFQTNDFRTLHL